ncbi:lantibiotic dehydratase [Streptomyces armeniacus]|nr:lantibiotic dehydratase [Streptomyces armeniacus]
MRRQRRPDPRLLDHEIPVAVYADRAAPGTLDLDDIGVCADRDELRLVRLSDGAAVLHTFATDGAPAGEWDAALLLR